MSVLIQHKTGTLFVITAPSGAGKSSLVKIALKQLSNLSLSVSHTTRGKRNGEHEGVDYHYIDRPRFDQMVAEEEFLEWAKVHENCYGTSLKTITDGLERGRKDILLDIDVQGVETLKKKKVRKYVRISPKKQASLSVMSFQIASLL